MQNCTIYYDPDAVDNHEAGTDSMECGSRVKLDITKYQEQGFKIVYPKNQKKYFKFAKSLHKNNQVFKYLSSNPFEQNIIQKIFKIKPTQKKVRNCHGCTSVTCKTTCEICQTTINNDKFYKYAHLIDSNIIDSDTTYLTPTSLTAIKNSVSLVCQMIDDMAMLLTRTGFAIIRPPGHHACASKSGGFCLINNIAIAAEYATVVYGLKKIFIFDFDAHHGNGTQNIFYERNDVFYCSIHTIDAYPRSGLESETGVSAGVGYNLNIIVDRGIDGDSYLEIFNSRVMGAIYDYEPDLILVSAGFDGLESDPMRIMKLSISTYKSIVNILSKCECYLGLVLEGGYNLEDLPQCYDICLKELAAK